MTRLTIFLFFFTLSTMAQQVQDTLGKVKTSQEVANTNSTLKVFDRWKPTASVLFGWENSW